MPQDSNATKIIKEKQEREITGEELQEWMEGPKLSGIPKIMEQVTNKLFITNLKEAPPKVPIPQLPTTPGSPLLQPIANPKLPSDGISSAPTPTLATTATTSTKSAATTGAHPILQATTNNFNNPMGKEIE